MCSPEYQDLLQTLMDQNEKHVTETLMELQCKNRSPSSNSNGPLEPTGINQYNSFPRHLSSLPFSDDVLSSSIASELPTELQIITGTLERMALESMSNSNQLPIRKSAVPERMAASSGLASGNYSSPKRSCTSLREGICSLNLPSFPFGGFQPFRPNRDLDQLNPGFCNEWWWGIESGDAATSTDNPSARKGVEKQDNVDDIPSSPKSAGHSMKAKVTRGRAVATARKSRVVRRAQHAYRRQCRQRVGKSGDEDVDIDNENTDLPGVTFVLNSDSESDEEGGRNRRSRSRSSGRKPNTHKKLGTRARSMVTRRAINARPHTRRHSGNSRAPPLRSFRRKASVSSDYGEKSRKRFHASSPLKITVPKSKRRQQCRCIQQTTKMRPRRRGTVLLQ